ncbi:MAG: hypothetical protein KDB48_04565 [Solirubrobacterales bacterium]|nr:hypothetical protein [Solirubrobacterales bacterium]HMT06214.1 hypothetical protein [Solirubrobacterales bacterium]
MKTIKNIFGVLLLVAVLGSPADALAGDESVELSMDAKVLSGSLYREVPRPVSARLHIKVKVPEAQDSVTPMINSRVTFPEDMSFYPNPQVTPVCGAEKIGQSTNLGLGVARIIDLCPRSVVGTGTARIHLAQNKSGILDDPELVIFNGGADSQGRPKITIYGYSKAAGAGLLMSGSLAKSGELNIAIGVMPFDSSIADFTLGIPGDTLAVEDIQSPGGTLEVNGQDPGFLRAVCSKGVWEATGVFDFATRSDSSGELTSPVTSVGSNSDSLPCKGLAGRPKIKLVRLAGNRGFRAGGSNTYTLRFRNTGTASLRQAVLRATGGGKGQARLGTLAPGQTRTVRLKVRFDRAGKARRSLKFAIHSPNGGLAKMIGVRESG